jgi:ABC-type ATPase with predicted acetyltransferase domain
LLIERTAGAERDDQMSTTAATPKTTAASKGRGASQKSKVTANASVTDPTASGASTSLKTKKVSLAELLAQHAPDAASAADLAKRAGVADDTAFRRAVTHHSQGSRMLSQYREKFIVAGDENVYVERRGQETKEPAVASSNSKR